MLPTVTFDAARSAPCSPSKQPSTGPSEPLGPLNQPDYGQSITIVVVGRSLRLFYHLPYCLLAAYATDCKLDLLSRSDLCQRPASCWLNWARYSVRLWEDMGVTVTLFWFCMGWMVKRPTLPKTKNQQGRENGGYSHPFYEYRVSYTRFSYLPTIARAILPAGREPLHPP